MKSTSDKSSTRKTPTKKQTELGASLVEYALLVALIAVVCMAAVTSIGTKSSKKFSSVTSAMS